MNRCAICDSPHHTSFAHLPRPDAPAYSCVYCKAVTNARIRNCCELGRQADRQKEKQP